MFTGTIAINVNNKNKWRIYSLYIHEKNELSLQQHAPDNEEECGKKCDKFGEDCVAYFKMHLLQIPEKDGEF